MSCAVLTVSGCQARLGVAGACEAVISAVQRHADSRVIADKGFRALANLAVSNGNSGWLGPAGACTGESPMCFTATLVAD